MEKNIGSTEWMIEAECRGKDPKIFFPSSSAGVDIARRICAECVVKQDCLDYALANKIGHGVWGGTSERERNRILKAMLR
jgi:WhiB family redox-sensing transcriptional regulator